jgi:hypothetical protein
MWYEHINCKRTKEMRATIVGEEKPHTKYSTGEAEMHAARRAKGEQKQDHCKKRKARINQQPGCHIATGAHRNKRINHISNLPKLRAQQNRNGHGRRGATCDDQSL